MWDWVLNSNPIAGMIVGDLTAEQQAMVRQVLGRMIRGRSGGHGPAVLTAPSTSESDKSKNRSSPSRWAWKGTRVNGGFKW